MNRTAKVLLVTALVVVVAMAFRVSWNAQRDVATSVGADHTAALLYPFVVDGLVALALVATLVLTGADRRFALRVLAGYTVASLVLNYVHGLVPALHAHAATRMHLADWAPANWALVLLATSLPVGSIFFGSDLVAKVLHHRPTVPSTEQAPVASPAAVEPTPAPAPASEPVPEAPEPAAPAKSAPARRPRGSKQGGGAKPGRRSLDDVLADARTATASWPAEHLTADRIRRAVQCGAGHARAARDALRAERDGQTGEVEAVAA
jgi:hypothetical protein